jgi:hypothetical protein
MVPPGVLATSNGHSGRDREQMGSTSSNLKNSSLLGGSGDEMGGGGLKGLRPGIGVLVGLVGGGVVFVFGWAGLFVLG